MRTVFTKLTLIVFAFAILGLSAQTSFAGPAQFIIVNVTHRESASTIPRRPRPSAATPAPRWASSGSSLFSMRRLSGPRDSTATCRFAFARSSLRWDPACSAVPVRSASPETSPARCCRIRGITSHWQTNSRASISILPSRTSTRTSAATSISTSGSTITTDRNRIS